MRFSSAAAAGDGDGADRRDQQQRAAQLDGEQVIGEQRTAQVGGVLGGISGRPSGSRRSAPSFGGRRFVGSKGAVEAGGPLRFDSASPGGGCNVPSGGAGAEADLLQAF